MVDQTNQISNAHCAELLRVDELAETVTCAIRFSSQWNLQLHSSGKTSISKIKRQLTNVMESLSFGMMRCCKKHSTRYINRAITRNQKKSSRASTVSGPRTEAASSSGIAACPSGRTMSVTVTTKALYFQPLSALVTCYSGWSQWSCLCSR